MMMMVMVMVIMLLSRREHGRTWWWWWNDGTQWQCWSNGWAGIPSHHMESKPLILKLWDLLFVIPFPFTTFGNTFTTAYRALKFEQCNQWAASEYKTYIPSGATHRPAERIRKFAWDESRNLSGGWRQGHAWVGGALTDPLFDLSVHRCRTSYQLLHKLSFGCYHHHQTEKWCINKPWLRPSSWIVVKAGFEEHQGSLFQITGHCGLLLLRKGLCDHYLLYNWIHLLYHRSLSAFPDKCHYDLKSGIFDFRCACSS